MLSQNMAAFQATISHSEGSDRAADPYRVVYAFEHTIVDLSDHPAITGEWTGKTLTDLQCANAGVPSGTKSTAAGRYQINKPTWLRLKALTTLTDFRPASQDLACYELIRECKAVQLVEDGVFIDAIMQCRHVWASLPGNTSGQPQKTYAQLLDAYLGAGGMRA